MRKHTTLIATATALAVLSTSIAMADGEVYEIVDLGDPNTSDCFCANQAINSQGDTAGFFFGPDNTYNAFLHTGGQSIDISPPGDNLTFARGMNDAGAVVGFTTHYPPQRAFLYDGQDFINLGTLGGTYSDANDINNAGWIVGSASNAPPDDYEHAAVWRNGDITDLGTLGGPFSEANAVSENGMIVGWSWNAAWDQRAVYWTADLVGPFELPSFSAPELFTFAVDVNEAGQIVGAVYVESPDPVPPSHAALWENGTVADLGLLPEAGQGVSFYGGPAHVSTAATGINNAGVIVGNSIPAAATPEVRFGPFIYRDNVMTNLNDLLHASAVGWMVTEAVAINDDGLIACNGRFDGGEPRSILLVPVDPADLDGDGVVAISDLLILLATWGECPLPPEPCIADIDGDGSVGVGDLLILLASWS